MDQGVPHHSSWEYPTWWQLYPEPYWPSSQNPLLHFGESNEKREEWGVQGGVVGRAGGGGESGGCEDYRAAGGTFILETFFMLPSPGYQGWNGEKEQSKLPVESLPPRCPLLLPEMLPQLPFLVRTSRTWIHIPLAKGKQGVLDLGLWFHF